MHQTVLYEEPKEFTYSVGGEYLYQDSLLFRMWDILTKVHGARKFSSLGAGFKYNVVKVDVSYLFSASKVKKNPLENTLRFSLQYLILDKGL
jgi:hypothetical protein